MVFLLNYGVGHLNFTYGGVLDPNLIAGHENTLLIVFVAAFFGFGVKAAIFPFYKWLPDASVAPTPGLRPAACSGSGEGRRLRHRAADLLRLRRRTSCGGPGPRTW